MRSCSSISGTRSARNSSRAVAHEDTSASCQHVGMADMDLFRRAIDLAMGIRSARQISGGPTASARSLLCLETFGYLRALSHPELSQVQDGRIQWLVQRRLCQVHDAQ